MENKFRHENTADEKRKEHQKELMHKMNEEALRRIKEGGDKKETVRKKKAPVSYQKGSYLPRAKEVQSLQVWVHLFYILETNLANAQVIPIDIF